MAIVTGKAKVLATSSGTEALAFVFGENGVVKPSDTGKVMIDYLPQYMQDGTIVRALQEGIALEIERVKRSKDDLILQFFIDTATWGLKYWEELAGIPVQDDIPENYPQRRSIIKAALSGRRFESEFWFKKRIEDLLGTVIIKDLDPETHPYRVEIESTAQIVEEPPIQHATASIEPSAGNLDGQYTYRVTYVFATGETTYNQGQIVTNEIQLVEADATPTGGTFTLTYDDVMDPNGTPNPNTTDPIPYDASAADVQAALRALPNLASYNPPAVNVTGGGLDAGFYIEFVHDRRGQDETLIVADDSLLTGASINVTEDQQGGTTYEDSESNTVVPVNQQVLLQNVPVSDSGCIARRIYRKKNPSMDYFLVAEIPDNEQTYYYDDVSDADVALANVPLPFQNTAINALGIAARDFIAKTKPAHLHVELTNEMFRASINAAGDRV